MDFVAHFLGRRLAYTYEVVELGPGRLVMRTAQGPFPMETTYIWQPVDDASTRMTLRNRGEPAGFARVARPVMAAAIRRATRRTSPASNASSNAATPFTDSSLVTDRGRQYDWRGVQLSPCWRR